MENKAETVEDFFGPVISSYTRADALADGMLVDVSEMAQKPGLESRWQLLHQCGKSVFIGPKMRLTDTDKAQMAGFGMCYIWHGFKSIQPGIPTYQFLNRIYII